jgi:hypothetical protein
MKTEEIYLGFGLYLSSVPREPILRLRALKPGADDAEILLDERTFEQIRHLGQRFWSHDKKTRKKWYK